MNTNTYFLGTINNKNNFQLNGGSGANAVLLIDSSNVMLQGGGTVTMSTAAVAAPPTLSRRPAD